MKILLLANQPEKTTRLLHFKGSLERLGYEVAVPSFKTRNWISIGRQAKALIERERPQVVHIFNVPDVIYRKIPQMKGKSFDSLIYDYRSPWGIELEMTFGWAGKMAGEHYERILASWADAITTVNTPLGEKVRGYAPKTSVTVIPNYPAREFSKDRGADIVEGDAIVFIGRVCTQEGIGKLLEVARECPDREFWIVGSGPFAWWYLRRAPENIRYFGWQPYTRVAEIVAKAKICLIPREENPETPYSTDKSIWKLNEYLNMDKIVIASGITSEEQRKNLIIVKSSQLKDTIMKSLDKKPKRLEESDYRYWDSNDRIIKSIYDKFEKKI